MNLISLVDGHELMHGCHNGYCWSYCGASWKGGEWCYTKAANENDYQTCRTNDYCKCSFKDCWSNCALF